MRTTLKRRAGRNGSSGGRPPRARGGEVGGPGSPAGPPLGPVTRYAAWKKSRWRLAGRIAAWLALVCLVAAGALGGGVWLYLNESVAAVRPHSAPVLELEEQEILEAPAPGQPTTAILIGYDARKGAEADAGRSDTIMLLRADPGSETISLLSFPRDLVVDHPGCPRRGIGPFRDRINVAYTLCGPAGTVRTVKELTGIPINYAIVVNFRGFQDIVNEVGGVYVDVDRRYFNDVSGPSGYATIDLQPGYQRLQGPGALDFARFRHTDSDLHRIARQQAFVKAFKQQVQASFSILRLPGVIDAIVENVEVVKGGRKAKLSVEEVLGYARFLYELPSGHFFQAGIEGLTGFAELDASPESIEGAVRDFLNPDVEAAEKATQAAQGRQPTGRAPQPSETTIEVLNGNGAEGAADTAALALQELGYDARPAGNADPEGDGVPNFDYFQTQVVYDPAAAGAEASGRVVANLFGDAELVAATPEIEISTMLKVIVGQTFHGAIADASVDDTPEHQPPAVERVYEDVLPLLRDARRRVDFRPLVPTVREESSELDGEVPFRVYSVAKHDAIRIVYRTAASRYWGIQQTSWSEAPLLAGESLTRRSGGRAYRLYYEGSKLHMVAFEEAGAVYWVSNTLLNDLTNETMLEIAKGLRPLASVQ